MDLVQDRLDAIAKAAREDGWRDAEGQLYRPDSYWMRGHLEPAGERDPTEEETAQLVEIEAAIAKRKSEVDEDDHDYDDELSAMHRKQDAIVSAYRVFSAEQKAEHSLNVSISHHGNQQVA